MSLVIALLEAVAVASLVGLILVGLGYLSLPLLFVMQRQTVPPAPPLPPDAELPFVLVQLAVFNEPAVVSGLLRSVAALDWPKDKLVIQLLDDSTDETTAIAAAVIVAALCVRRLISRICTAPTAAVSKPAPWPPAWLSATRPS